MSDKAAPSLLDRDIPPDYRHEWTEHVAEKIVAAEENTESVVIFRVGTEWLSIPTAWFQSIAEITPIHSLPQRRSTIIMGIADVRGELLICISLAALLGISSNVPSASIPAQNSAARFMVLRGAGGLGKALGLEPELCLGLMRLHNFRNLEREFSRLCICSLWNAR